MEKIQINVREKERWGNFLEIAPYAILLALIFLLPIFFVASPSISLGYSKLVVISIAVILSIFAWIVHSFKSGKLLLPTGWFFLSILGIAVVFLIAAFFSPNRSVSFIGSGLDVGSFSFILLMLCLMFLVSVFMRSRERIFYCYLWFGAGFLLAAIYQILHVIIGPNFLSLGYFTDVVSSPIGSWNDVGVIAGSATLLTLISLELLVLRPLFKVLLYIILVICLFLLILTNFTIIWASPITIVTLVGLFALVLFVYFLSNSTQNGSADASRLTRSRKIPVPSLVVLIFAIVFTLAAGPLNSYITSFFHINSLTVSPTWQTTMIISKGALSHNPALGVGPNRFDREWNLSRPAEVNLTDFWNTDFQYGVGLIPTFLITGGILGLLSWLVFLGLFVYLGWKALFADIKDRFSLYLIISSFFISIYLWIVHILYVPGLVIFSFASIFTGLFLASLFREGLLKEKTISYIQDSRKGFVVILFLVATMIGAVAWGYVLSNKVMASVSANRAASALNKNDPDAAEKIIVQSLAADKDPSYYRFLSQIEMVKMANLLKDSSLSAEVIKNQFQTLLSNSLAAANAAVTGDPTDYQNWLSLGSVYEAVVPLGIADANTQAQNAYQEALKRNPKNPAIYLFLARLQATNKNNTKAKEYIGEALKLKNNYLDALYLLAEIDLSAGNTSAATTDLAAAISVAPNNANVYFQSGILNYNLGNYQVAASAFSQALVLVPDYADSQYYLALSAYKLNQKDVAIKLFQALSRTNPKNETLTTILNNLKAGRDPLFTSSDTSATSTKK